eukprot:53280-Chlamydomonas_euryale.AAC.3
MTTCGTRCSMAAPTAQPCCRDVLAASVPHRRGATRSGEAAGGEEGGRDAGDTGAGLPRGARCSGRCSAPGHLRVQRSHLDANQQTDSRRCMKDIGGAEVGCMGLESG